MKISVLHLINSLETGGAETQLLHLLKEVNQQIFEWHLGYLHKSGELLNNYHNPKIRIIDLSERGKFSLIKIAGLFQLYKKASDCSEALAETIFFWLMILIWKTELQSGEEFL